MQNENEEHTANEPAAEYLSKTSELGRLVIFKSFEEAEDYHNKWLAKQTPIQHLQNALKLIKMFYQIEPSPDAKIGTNFKID